MEQNKQQVIDSALRQLDEMSEGEAEQFMSANLDGLAAEAGHEPRLETRGN